MPINQILHQILPKGVARKRGPKGTPIAHLASLAALCVLTAQAPTGYSAHALEPPAAANVVKRICSPEPEPLDEYLRWHRDATSLPVADPAQTAQGLNR
jgi:hypothetical protein